MAGGPMGGGQATSPARQQHLMQTGQTPMGGQPMGGAQNPYQQSAGAYGNALNTVQQATQFAQNMPVATANAVDMANARDVNAGQLASTNLDPYMNPFQDQVINQATADMERARLIQQNQANDAMTQAGAFGGSRHGIANAETNRNFYDRLGSMTSNLRQQNFANAQQMGLADIGNRMQADMSNQGADLTTNQYNASAQNQANLANAQMKNTARQNQFSNMMQGAGMFSGLADQGFGFGQDITAQQMAQGALTRGINQQTIDAGRQQFQNFANQGNMGLSPLAQFAGGDYGGSTSTSNNPGLLGTLGAGLQIAKAIPGLSDRRLKTNLQPRNNINGIQFYDWDWTEEGKRLAGDQPTFGVIADELEQMLPDLVITGDDGFKRVNYAGLARELG